MLVKYVIMENKNLRKKEEKESNFNWISSVFFQQLKLSKELSDMINYIQSVHFGGFEKAMKGKKKYL